MITLYEIAEKTRKKEQILLIFDYDGTLTPIVKNPDAAFLKDKVKLALEKLAKSNSTKIAVVTGRKIETLKKLSKIDSTNITIFGLHGGEMEVNNQIIGGIYDDKDVHKIKNFYAKLSEKCKNLEEIFIENKIYTVSLHYRNASLDTSKIAMQMFKESIIETKISSHFKIQKGKKVIELLPKDFNKSEAVKRLIENNPNYVPIYFGDDITDISAFEQCKKLGGYAIAIIPHSKFPDIADLEIPQNELETFILDISSEYGNNRLDI